MIVVTMITGKLHGKLDPAWLVLVGAIVLSVATWEFSQLKMDSSVGFIIFWMAIRYIGVGLATSPVTTISMRDIPSEFVGDASAISNWLRQVVCLSYCYI